MSKLRNFVPKILKHYFRFITSKTLKIPYNRYGIPNEILSWLPLQGEISVIDIGASEGNFFHRIAQLYQIKEAILIEPLPKRVLELKEKYSAKPNYQIIDVAIESSRGEKVFYVSQEFDYVSSLLLLEDEEINNLQIKRPISIKIKTDTLDNIYRQSGLKTVDFIKIDVQGVEHLVLEYGRETLENTKLVFIEVSYRPLYKGSSTFFDIYSFFIASNFRLVNINHGYHSANGELLQSDALFVNNRFF